MHDLVDAFERLEKRGLVADIADDDIGIGIKAVRARARAVDLLDHAVENAHLVPAGEQGPRHIAADEARAACDEDRIRQRSVSSCSRSLRSPKPHERVPRGPRSRR